MKEKVILDPAFRRMGNIFTAEDLKRLEAVCDVIWAKDEPMPASEIDKVSSEVIAIITGNWRQGEVSRFPRLRAILEAGGGFPSSQSLNYPECFARGIHVLSCAPAFGPAVAELGLGLALASTRQIAWTDQAFRSGLPQWSHTEFNSEIGEPFTLYGKTVGFIGFGGLARFLKPLLDPFGVQILAYDPWLTDAYLRAQGVTPAALDTLLATSKVIFVLALPTIANKGMLGKERLALIHPDAVFILLSRAHPVDFEALTEAVLAGRFRAGIDVYPQEPLAEDHPIRKAKHAVLSSHRAGANPAGLLRIGRLIADDIEAICAGKAPWSMQQATAEFIRLRDDPAAA